MATISNQGLAFFESISNEILLSKGNILDQKNIYYLKEGICVLTYLTQEGEESSFIYFRPDSLLNFLPSMLSANYVNSSTTRRHVVKMNHAIYTKTDCKLLCVEGGAFLQYVDKNPEHYRFLVEGILDNFINLLAVSTDISVKTASIRVCQVLLDFMVDDESGCIPRYLNHAEIASYLSLHVITVTKIFKALQENGIVSKQGQQKIVLNKKRLIDIVKGKETLVY